MEALLKPAVALKSQTPVGIVTLQMLLKFEKFMLILAEGTPVIIHPISVDPGNDAYVIGNETPLSRTITSAHINAPFNDTFPFLSV